MGVLSSRYFRVGVAVCLIGILLYPGALSSPYSDQPGHYHNSIDAQAPDVDSLEHHAISADTAVYQYDELSPPAREIFDTARVAADGRFSLTVCQEWALVCDEYTESELPDEFAYGTTSHTWSDAAVIVTDTDGAYVFVTGDPGHADGWDVPSLPELFVSQVSSLAILLYAVALAYTGFRPSDRLKKQSQPYDVVAGVLIGGFALLAPYLHMVGLISVFWAQTLLVGSLVLWAGSFYRVRE